MSSDALYQHPNLFFEGFLANAGIHEQKTAVS